MQDVWVWSLVGELRSYMPWGQKTRKTFKMVHFKKKNNNNLAIYWIGPPSPGVKEGQENKSKANLA